MLVEGGSSYLLPGYIQSERATADGPQDINGFLFFFFKKSPLWASPKRPKP